MLILQKPWDSQPQELCGPSPEFRDSARLLYSGSAPFHNLVNGAAAAGTGTGQTSAVTPHGVAAVFSGAGTADLTWLGGTNGAATFVFAGQITSSVSGDRIISSYNGVGDPGQYELYQNGTSVALQSFRTTPDEWRFTRGGANLTTWEGVLVVCVTGTDDPRAWIDGEELGIVRTATGSGVQKPTGTRVAVANRPDSNTRQLGGRVALTALLSADIGDSVAKDISRNPWQIFEARRVYIPTSISGGGAYTLNLETGSYSFTGSDAVLLKNSQLTLDSSSYSITGSNASLLKDLILEASSGTYTLSGSDASLLYTHLLSASSGTYTINGADATLTYTPASGTYTLNAESGTYLLAGSDVTFIYSGSEVTIKAGSWIRYRIIT